VTASERHERAVARSLGFAQEAAASGDLRNALGGLRVVEVVDGGLPREWARTRVDWLDRERSAEPVFGPATGADDALEGGAELEAR
jgi:hypothetical protein